MKNVQLSRRKFFGLAAGAAVAASVSPNLLPVAEAAEAQKLVTITPVGSLNAFVGPEAPEGFMWCYGQELEAADYHSLFDLIGRLYGGDEKRGTFRLPDLRTRAVMSPVMDGHGSLSHFNVPDVAGHVHTIGAGPTHNHAHVVYEAGPHNNVQPVMIINYVIAVDDVRIEWTP
jgi:microcystin-dependent protein